MSSSYRYRTGRTARFRRAKGPVAVVALLIVAAVGSGTYAVTRPTGKVAGDSTVATSADRNDTRRKSLEHLADALSHYRSTHNATLPIKLLPTPVEICSASPADCKNTKLADLNFLLSSNELSSLPTDPIGGPGRFGSGLTIAKDVAGRFVLNAPRAEDGVVISVTR